MGINDAHLNNGIGINGAHLNNGIKFPTDHTLNQHLLLLHASLQKALTM